MLQLGIVGDVVRYSYLTIDHRCMCTVGGIPQTDGSPTPIIDASEGLTTEKKSQN